MSEKSDASKDQLPRHQYQTAMSNTENSDKVKVQLLLKVYSYSNTIL